MKTEYIDLKEFARRLGYSQKYAWQMFHSKEMRPFVRQNGYRCKLMLNWTAWQEWYERTKQLVI